MLNMSNPYALPLTSGQLKALEALLRHSQISETERFDMNRFLLFPAIFVRFPIQILYHRWTFHGRGLSELDIATAHSCQKQLEFIRQMRSAWAGVLDIPAQWTTVCSLGIVLPQ